MVNVDVVENNAVLIAASLAATMPMGATPTRVTLEGAAAHLSNRGDANPRITSAWRRAVCPTARLARRRQRETGRH
jgi:hypothetical protein